VRCLVLWADEISTNLGVRALAAGAAALVERASPGANVQFQSFGRRGPTPVQFGTKSAAMSFLHGPSELLRWLGEFDLLVDTRAGDSFADIYGNKRLLTMSLIAELAHTHRIPLIMAPQTIGPFSGRLGLTLARRALRNANFSAARDSESFAFASAIGAPADLLATDVVFALPQPVCKGTQRDVILNISGLLWHAGPHVDWRSYRSTVRLVYDQLIADGRSIVLLPHVLASNLPDNDEHAIQQFVATLPHEAEVTVPKTLNDARVIMAGANLVIGSRMHACLNAISVGTPAISMSYSRKFAPLLKDLGWEGTVDLRSNYTPALEVVKHSNRDDLLASVGGVRERAETLLAGVTQAIAGLI